MPNIVQIPYYLEHISQLIILLWACFKFHRTLVHISSQAHMNKQYYVSQIAYIPTCSAFLSCLCIVEEMMDAMSVVAPCSGTR